MIICQYVVLAAGTINAEPRIQPGVTKESLMEGKILLKDTAFNWWTGRRAPRAK